MTRSPTYTARGPVEPPFGCKPIGVHSSPETGASIPTGAASAFAANHRLAFWAGLALRSLTFAILGFGPWWLAVEFLYA